MYIFVYVFAILFIRFAQMLDPVVWNAPRKEDDLAKKMFDPDSRTMVHRQQAAQSDARYNVRCHGLGNI